jgi:hypothetical protein
MDALLNPTNHTRGGIKWGLAAYTATMFVVETINISMALNLLPISYIDNRELPGNDELPPGPLGYQILVSAKAITLVPNFMGLINNWLADGLLVDSVFNSAA